MQATVVSLLPYRIGPEVKPGISPSEYIVPAAVGDKPGILYVPDGTRGIYLDQDRGSEMVVADGRVIAKSIVDDYVTSQPAQDQTSSPGVFFVEGRVGIEEIKTKYRDLMEHMGMVQREWWKRLVRLADDAWQRSHIIAQISDLDRTACRSLGLKRDWLDDSPDSVIKCPVCTTLVSSSAIVCFACKVVLKPEELSKFQFVGNAVPVQSVNAKS